MSTTSSTIVLDPTAHPVDAIRCFAQDLLSALVAGAAVRLDLSQYRMPDIRLVQAVEAAREYAETVGAGLSLAGPVDGDFRQLLERAGFPTDAGATFWFQEKASQ